MWKTIKITSAIALSLFLTSCTKDVKKTQTEFLGDEAVPSQQDTIEISGDQSDNKEISYKKFEGAWFDTEYPSNFSAENSLKSPQKPKVSTVPLSLLRWKSSVYVFSPQWSGKPCDIKIDEESENLIDSSEEKNGKITVKRWLIEANNGSYHSAYEETIDNESKTNKIFGVKYNPDDYENEYEQEYLHFKKALVQYAD